MIRNYQWHFHCCEFYFFEMFMFYSQNKTFNISLYEKSMLRVQTKLSTYSVKIYWGCVKEKYILTKLILKIIVLYDQLEISTHILLYFVILCLRVKYRDKLFF